MLDVDTGRDLDKLEPLWCQFEYTAFRYIKHGLPTLHRIAAGKRAMFNFIDKLHHITVLVDAKVPVLDRNTEASRCECADEHQLLGILTDIDKAAGARQARTKFAHIQVAFAVSLREPKKGCVKPAAVIKVELIGLIDNGLCVNRRSKIEPSCRHAANDARFGGKREQISNFLLVSDGCDALRHADAEIDNAVCIKFERRTPAMIFRSFISIEVTDPAGARISPLNAGSY